ncbi:hypothetical protein EYF80_058290 [Liparis tanakae]|uniref:Uncharacterized protein n=1 Tax=Liparis tanakae TaxID=230148 RepID=A0A4Z2ERX1_9TELE|nr:hypothetical protein EYF80_058290 [Liparis tanakae]
MEKKIKKKKKKKDRDKDGYGRKGKGFGRRVAIKFSDVFTPQFSFRRLKEDVSKAASDSPVSTVVTVLVSRRSAERVTTSWL